MTSLTSPSHSTTCDEVLPYARQVILDEAAALREVAARLGDSFARTAELVFNSPGRICITGTGKSADVGQKITGTLNSTGTRAYLLDATRAVHGDLGMLHKDDVVLALSHSGETEEVIRLLGPFKRMAHAVVALTSNENSTLARESDEAIIIGPLAEVCPMGLAPSTSTTAMIAVGDALAFSLLRMRKFKVEDFALLHPAGSLGRKLMKVEEVMRKGSELRLALSSDSVRDVFAQQDRAARRTGAVILVDEAGRLHGLFTDSDLARLFASKQDNMIDRPIAEVMTRSPVTARLGSRLIEAVDQLRHRKISEIPVVDHEGRPVGLIDITDVISFMPAQNQESDSTRIAA